MCFLVLFMCVCMYFLLLRFLFFSFETMEKINKIVDFQMLLLHKLWVSLLAPPYLPRHLDFLGSSQTAKRCNKIHLVGLLSANWTTNAEPHPSHQNPFIIWHIRPTGIQMLIWIWGWIAQEDSTPWKSSICNYPWDVKFSWAGGYL